MPPRGREIHVEKTGRNEVLESPRVGEDASTSSRMRKLRGIMLVLWCGERVQLSDGNAWHPGKFKDLPNSS